MCCCCCWVASVVSNSVWPHRRQPTRLPHPWDSPGKNTGVGCHCLLQCMKVKVKLLSRARLLATPWTAAYQAPPSMGFSRQEYWSAIAFSEEIYVNSTKFKNYKRASSERYICFVSLSFNHTISHLRGNHRYQFIFHFLFLSVYIHAYIYK